MGTNHPDLFAALAAPFEATEVKVRSVANRQIHYITARNVMNRLDNVLGPESWWDAYVPHENSVMCILTIRLPDGSCIAKADAGGHAGMADAGDDDKSGYSDAFKRAAVKFGIARYLYRDGVPEFVSERTGRTPVEPSAHGHEKHDHDPDRLPSQARQPTTPEPAKTPRAANGTGTGNGHAGPPRTGKALYAWTKDQEQRHEVGLLKYINGWARLQDFPGRMVDWDAEQVRLAHLEALRKLASLQGPGDSYEGQEEALTN